MVFTDKFKFIVCIDSDGCAMDTMDIKHIKFFGPLAAEIFAIKDKTKFLEEWNRINLFSKTRGINRFKGLLLGLKFAEKNGESIEDHTVFQKWCDETLSLSNQSLEEAYATSLDPVLKKALEWSKAVNNGIESELKGKDRPFEGVKEALEVISQSAQIAIVSSANSGAVNSEWERHGLMQFVSEFFGQERGSKFAAIKEIKSQGFSPENILMIGDAPGDLEAAKNNGVHFYPILYGKEKESWSNLINGVLKEFLDNKYNDSKYQEIYSRHLEEAKNK